MDQAGALLGGFAAVLSLSGTLIDDRLAVGLLAVVATEADSLAIDLDRDLGVGSLAADGAFAGFKADSLVASKLATNVNKHDGDWDNR